MICSNCNLREMVRKHVSYRGCFGNTLWNCECGFVTTTRSTLGDVEWDQDRRIARTKEQAAIARQNAAPLENGARRRQIRDMPQRPGRAIVAVASSGPKGATTKENLT